jgi:tetratricopeptide (TPR) repeat protein
MGAIQAELGRRQEALDSYRAGVAVREEVDRRFPNDVHSRHELMLAYSHVGDTLGNPTYDNFGDEAGARAAYVKMAEVARILREADPTDVRALSDYGIALLRLGIVSPPNQQRMTLEKSHELLQSAATRNPTDKPTRTHKAWVELALGDAFVAGGDHAQAARYYQMAIATCEGGTLTDPTDQRRLIEASRKLAAEQIRFGDSAGTLRALDKVEQLAQRLEAEAPEAGATSVTIRSVIASAWQARGFINSRLGNRDIARESYQRSMAEWKKLASLPGFTSLRRKEMESTASELVSLDVSQR